MYTLSVPALYCDYGKGRGGLGFSCVDYPPLRRIAVLILNKRYCWCVVAIE